MNDTTSKSERDSRRTDHPSLKVCLNDAECWGCNGVRGIDCVGYRSARVCSNNDDLCLGCDGNCTRYWKSGDEYIRVEASCRSLGECYYLVTRVRYFESGSGYAVVDAKSERLLLTQSEPSTLEAFTSQLSQLQTLGVQE